jgi:prepilin-type N-terminal cleavage/methylation domain-containing protein
MGFTLIELLISAAIITVITSIVLVRFNAFDSTVLLKSIAYEVGTSVREAQIYSVSVINVVGDTNFRTPYGLHFVNNGSSYTFFRYNDALPRGETPQYSGADPVTPVRVAALGGRFQILKICAAVVSGPDICTLTELDISFRRPEFSALFYSPSLTTPQLNSMSAAKLYITSTTNANNVWIVEVKLLGQVSTYRCTTSCS